MKAFSGLLAAALLVLGSSAFAQEEGIFGQEQQDQMGQQEQQQQQGSQQNAMATRDNKAYVLSGTTLFKIDLETLQREAETSLMAGQDYESWIKQHDQNQDDALSRDELTDWDQASKYDRDQDQKLSSDEAREYFNQEVHQEQQRQAQMQQQTQPRISVTDNEVLVLAQGKLYKFNVDDLSQVGSVEIQQQQGMQQDQQGMQAEQPEEEPLFGEQPEDEPLFGEQPEEEAPVGEELETEGEPY
jgi:hypothetical protein